MDLLPRVVKELDPARPYWPGSPYSGTMELLASVDEHGNKHVWDAWNASDYGVYTSHPVRFSSEFGYQGPPTWAAIEAAIPPDQRSVDSDSMRHHQKQRNGVEKIRTRMSERYPVPDELGDWLYVGQLNQAHAVEYAVTFWRSLRPACMGTLYWQLNDCWPVVSWAAIDSTGKPKLLWYASKRMYRERVLAFHEVDGRIQLSADNDGGEDWQGTVSVRRLRFYGTVLGERKIELDVKAQAAARLLVISDAPELRPEAPADEMLVADVAGERAVWFFAPNKDLTLPRPQFEASLEQDGNLYRLTVTAGTLLVDLCVMADRLDADAQVLEQMVTLLGGESYTFEILSARQLTVEELTDPGVLKCANSFAAGK
jgi:beta-mannosidase